MKSTVLLSCCLLPFMLTGCGGQGQHMLGAQGNQPASVGDSAPYPKVSFSTVFSQTFAKPANADPTLIDSLESEPGDNASTAAQEGQYNAYTD